jgi:uncharacterized membrane protein
MSEILIAASYFLHSVATVIFIGHHLLLSLIHIPVLSKMEAGGGVALSEISKRSRNWMYASMLVFAVTGTVITLVDPNYLGLGNFNNVWAVLMLLKHILILGMVALGFVFNAILRVGSLMRSNTGSAPAIRRFRWYCNVMSISGGAVLLLTALAQIK